MRCLCLAALAWSVYPLSTRGASGSEIAGPPPRSSSPVVVRATHANHWQQGTSEVWLLHGNCQIVQGHVSASGQEAVLWVNRAQADSGQDSKVIVYLEGDVTVSYSHTGQPAGESSRRAQAIRDQNWLGRFYTSTNIEIQAPSTSFEPAVQPPLVQRGLAAREAEGQGPIQQVQFSSSLPGYMPERPPAPSGVVPWLAQPPLPGAGSAPPFASTLPQAPVILPAPASNRPTARRIVIRSRSNVRMQGKVFPTPDGQQTIAVITSGANVVVDGIQNLRGFDNDKIDIEADRIVIWTARLDALDLSGQSSGEKLQTRDTPLEFYLEGNIVFREGDRVVYAERMYYNVRQRYGLMLNAEILSGVPSYQGLVRLKADVLQQVNEFSFRARGAAVTSSRLGVPRYWLQADTIDFQDVQTERPDPLAGQPGSEAEPNAPAYDHKYLVRSRNNFLYVGGVPVFYWPVAATDLDQRSFYVNNIRVAHDGVFGYQAQAAVNMFQLLGTENKPDGTLWTVSPGYLSKRGAALGTNVRYDRDDFCGLPGLVHGTFEFWGLQDRGLDNLGLDRRELPHDDELRGRALWQHRQALPDGFQITAELGWISDRNFLEQFREREWDEHKDQTTGLELKRFNAHSSWSVTTDIRLNNFLTETEWLPRADHFLLGQSLFDRLTWFAHSQVGYARLQTAQLATSGPDSLQASLPWETDSLGNRYQQRTGLRAATRQELDLPLQLGPVKVTPYVLGEAAHWQQDVDQNQLNRLYGQAGVRTSLPFWTADPSVRNDLWNLNGLAHKVSLDADFFWADATRNWQLLPLYDPLDDNSTEHFQRRFIYNLPGGALPAKFDARYFAVRSGLQDWVTSPSTELAGDLMLAKLGVHQRWQTKRGAPGQERIVDWITLDVEGSLFPKAERDNFGQTLGLLNYDFRWHIGERLTLLSDGFMDLFDDGLKTFSMGGLLSRPEHGSVYVGIRSIEGPISSDVLTATVNYRMSEKWILNATAAVDLRATGNIGETLNFVRVGESFLVSVGMNIDNSRGSVGAMFNIEPRFLAGKLGRVGGVSLPPAGVLGLE